MAVKFIHTSDWQIRKVFRFLDDAAMGLLQEARLHAITCLGELADKHGVRHVLVAGDVYDKEALAIRALNQPMERMRNFRGVHWHLMPGNHDPHRPNGLWDQLMRRGVPDNVHIHITSEPVTLEDNSAVLLPAPLFHRRTFNDPTEYMDDVEIPDGIVRIGLAHGTVVGFGSDDEHIPNHISPDRPNSAGLSYLALGDWHGQREINTRCWYSGTPETDAFDVDGGGRALLVDIEGPRAVPAVQSLSTGQYTWTSLSEQINSRTDIDHLAENLRGSGGELNRVLVDLKVEGALSLEDRQYFHEEIIDGVSAALCFMRVDESRLFSQPTTEDLDRIDRGGFVRRAAEHLERLSKEGSEAEKGLAAAALQRLYIEHRKLEAELR